MTTPNNFAADQPGATAEIARVSKVLDGFIASATASLAGSADQGLDPRLMAFALGALDRLAAARGLDQTQTLALSVLLLNRYFAQLVAAAGSATALRAELEQDPDAKRFMREGAVSMADWLADDHEAPHRLAGLLKRH